MPVRTGCRKSARSDSTGYGFPDRLPESWPVGLPGEGSPHSFEATRHS